MFVVVVVREGEELLDLLEVALGHENVLAEGASLLRGLLVELVDVTGLLAHDLAAAGDPEALLGAAVRLVLRHGADLLALVVPACL